MKKKKLISKVLIAIIFLFIFINISYSLPFFGGFYNTNNYFENEKFTTSQSISFFLDHKFSENAKFYTRITAGFKFYTDMPEYNQATKIYSTPPKVEIANFTFYPNIDLAYFHFRAKKREPAIILEELARGETNYDLFNFIIGRTHVVQGSGFVLNTKGDGFDTFFTIKNFRFKMFAITNSFDYLPFFDFIGDGDSTPVFTKWDKVRMPPLTNRNLDGNTNGFISDFTDPEYNFYFNYDYDSASSSNNPLYSSDYSDSDRARLNNLRHAAVIAGRIFTGFSLDLLEFYLQNFALNFTANVDLIPDEFVQTFPSNPDQSINTFGGKYTSFYIGFGAKGKIYRGLFYDFDIIYQTGFTATPYISASRIIVRNEAIHSFAINHKISYYFDHSTKPTAHFQFLYAHGDKDVEFRDGTIVNQPDINEENRFDTNYKAPNSPAIGYALQPDFSNLIVLALTGSIKPIGFLKNDIFSRFSVQSVLLIYLRPIIEGQSFLSEKDEYKEEYSDRSGNIIKGKKYSSPEKAYLGVEFDVYLTWVIFSDLKVQLQTGVLVPNGKINADDYTPFWKVGLTFNISF